MTAPRRVLKTAAAFALLACAGAPWLARDVRLLAYPERTASVSWTVGRVALGCSPLPRATGLAVAQATVRVYVPPGATQIDGVFHDDDACLGAVVGSIAQAVEP